MLLLVDDINISSIIKKISQYANDIHSLALDVDDMYEVKVKNSVKDIISLQITEPEH